MRGKIVLRLGLLMVAGGAGCGSVSSMDAAVKQHTDSGADASTDGQHADQHDAAADVAAHDGTDARTGTKDAGTDARRDAATDVPHPHDAATDLPHPHDAATDIPHPRDAATDLPHPHDAAADVPHPHDAAADVPHPHDAAADVPHPHDAAADLPHPHDAATDLPHPHDAATDLPHPHDAATDVRPPACDPSQPFGTPALLTDFNTASNDDGVWLSDDGLTAYISSDRPGGSGGYDLWVAARLNVTDHFSAAGPVATVNTADDERQPVIGPDGLHLYFMTNHATGGTYDVVSAVRANPLATFTLPGVVAGLNGTTNDTGPWIAANGASIYFASDRAGGLGGNDIYVASLGTAGASAIVDVGALNSTADDGSPVLSRDGLTIYFSSKRTGGGAHGNDDIWVARRSVATDGFGTPTNVTELNSTAADGPRWLSADACTLYFTSTRTGVGGYDLYQATRGQ